MPPRLPLTSPTRYICMRCRSRLSATPPRPLSTTHRRPAHPIDDYYADILAQPLPASGTTSAPTSSPPSVSSSPSSGASSPPLDSAARARMLFGSRVPGPAEIRARKEERDRSSTIIAGVRVPPKPDEPTNCCMSGCVNCVWDGYRDELEEWAGRRREAERRERRMAMASREEGSGSSMDDDGGGSETNWTELGEEEVYEGVPVEIREFLKTEKRLAERRREREG